MLAELLDVQKEADGNAVEKRSQDGGSVKRVRAEHSDRVARHQRRRDN